MTLPPDVIKIEPVDTIHRAALRAAARRLGFVTTTKVRGGPITVVVGDALGAYRYGCETMKTWRAAMLRREFGGR